MLSSIRSDKGESGSPTKVEPISPTPLTAPFIVNNKESHEQATSPTHTNNQLTFHCQFNDMTPSIPPPLAELDSSNSSTSWSTSSESPDTYTKSLSPVKKTGKVPITGMQTFTSSPLSNNKTSLPPRPTSSPKSSSSKKKEKSNNLASKINQAVNVVEDDSTRKTTQKSEEIDLSKWVSMTSTGIVSDSSDDDDEAKDHSIVVNNNKYRRPRAISQNYSGVSLDSTIQSVEEERAFTIRFAPRNETYGIESHKDYTEKERNRCWYSSKEKDRMLHKHERVFSRMEQKKPPKRNQTYRGLEAWTTEGAQQLDQVIALSVNAVMDEQDRQWKADMDDFNLIAAKSIEVTADSARRARIVGIEDHQEALAVRRLAWTDSADDASCSSTVASSSIKSQTAANKRKKAFAKKRQRLSDADKGKSKTRTRSSSKSSKKGKKQTKRSNTGKKSKLKIEDKLRKIEELSQSEHLENNYTTPSLQAILASTQRDRQHNAVVASANVAGVSNKTSSTSLQNSKLGDDDDDNNTVSTEVRRAQSMDPPGRRVVRAPSEHGSEKLESMQRKVETVRSMQSVGRKAKDQHSKKDRDLLLSPSSNHDQDSAVATLVSPPASPTRKLLQRFSSPDGVKSLRKFLSGKRSDKEQ